MTKQTVQIAKDIHAVTGAKWPGVHYFCTWRTGGISKTPFASLNFGLHVGDEENAVLNNRKLLTAVMPMEAVWLNQVHGNEVHFVDNANKLTTATADALLTEHKNIPLAIMTADCMPVVLTDLSARVLAVAHAGWRGLAAGILQNTIAAMHNKMGEVVPLKAWIGPSINQSVFEVGAEVRQAFLQRNHKYEQYFLPSAKVTVHEGVMKKHYYADLPAIAKHIMQIENDVVVELSDECTHAQSDRYFSYRRDGQTGRQVTVAWLTNQVYPN